MKYQVIVLNYPNQGDKNYIYDTYDDINVAHRSAENHNKDSYFTDGQKYQYVVLEYQETPKQFIGPICWYCDGKHLGITCDQRKKL